MLTLCISNAAMSVIAADTLLYTPVLSQVSQSNSIANLYFEVYVVAVRYFNSLLTECIFYISND